MQRFFKSSFIQFLFLVCVVIFYSLVAKESLEPLIGEYIESISSNEVLEKEPSASPKVQGVTSTSEVSYVVSEVIDGDTIRIDTGDTIRYIGIDTPETKHPRIGKECFGEEAARFNEQLVLGKSIILEKDVNDTDRYGRLLRYVWLEGEMVNKILVEQGYAQASAYPPDIKYQVVLDAVEREARENGRGLWTSCATN